MRKEEFTFKSHAKENVNIRAVYYIPDKVDAILQISHGMVEFIERYENFAKFLNDKNIMVVGNDHLGHGGSVNSKDDWGYFSSEDGNKCLIEDLHALTLLTKEKYPGIPMFLLGHSMGSFYARQYICDYPNEFKAAIIMGTGLEAKATVKMGMMVCKLLASIKGWKYRSEFVNNMAFGSYNKKFEPARTKVDWLTKDDNIVDFYLGEERCTFLFTLNGYYNMFKGISRLHDKQLLNKMNKDMPVLFVSGKDDPVGNFGKGVEASYKTVKEAGVKDVSMKLYPNDRHEILNELDKENVYNDIYNWLKEKGGLQ